MLREIVIDDQDVAALFHEIFRNARRGIRRDISQPRCIVAFGDYDHGVIHRALFAEIRHDFGDGRRALADGAIHADHIFPALIQNAVEGDGGFARLPITQN